MPAFTDPCWKWEQRTGKLFSPEGKLVTIGYSGHYSGINNPALQDSHNIGPIPQGIWEIGEPAAAGGRLGPMALPLQPFLGTHTFGRSGFFLHGDSLEDVLEHTQCASHGCVVVGPTARRAVLASKVKFLLVK